MRPWRSPTWTANMPLSCTSASCAFGNMANCMLDHPEPPTGGMQRLLVLGMPVATVWTWAVPCSWCVHCRIRHALGDRGPGYDHVGHMAVQSSSTSLTRAMRTESDAPKGQQGASSDQSAVDELPTPSHISLNLHQQSAKRGQLSQDAYLHTSQVFGGFLHKQKCVHVGRHHVLFHASILVVRHCVCMMDPTCPQGLSERQH